MSPVALTDVLGLDVKRYPDAQRYTVSGVVGEGGMGRVYLGYDRKLDREVAIKVILDVGDDETQQMLRGRFYREAKASAALHHSSVVQIIDYSGPDCPQQYIVMERLLGHPLASYIDAAMLPESVAAAIGYSLCSALAEAHRVSLLHRDVKPENIFIEPNGRVVLVDFGLAKGYSTEHERHTFVGSKTRQLGTPLFGSPEQILGTAELSPQSDLYAVGAVLYYAVSQVTPYQGGSLIELFDAIRKKEPVPLISFTEVSQPFHDLVHALLARKPAKRPASAAVVAETLHAILGAAGVGVLDRHIADWTGRTPLPPPTMRPITRDLVAQPSSRPLAQTQSSSQLQIQSETQTSISTPRDQLLTSITSPPSQLRVTQGVTPLMGAEPPKKRGRIVAGVIVLLTLVLVAAAWSLLRPRGATSAKEVVETTPPDTTALPLVAPREDTLVRVTVLPWGKVSIDGAYYGLTPAFREVRLPAGRHVVKVENPKLGTKTVELVLNGEKERELEIEL